MALKLRPYQEDSRIELSRNFKQHQRQILCIPTGGGKTVIFSDIAMRSVSNGTETMIITDRIELFSQTFKSVARTGLEVAVIHAKSKANGSKDAFSSDAKVVHVAMIETLKRRFQKGLIDVNPRLIIIDEAHKRTFEAVFEMFPNAFVIGATATPVGIHLHKFYSHIVKPVDVPDLIDNGYLLQCVAYQMKEDLSDLKIKAGEYTKESLDQHYNKRTLFSGVVDQYIEKLKGKKTLIFNVNVEHAENMTTAFLETGIHAECVTSNTSPEARKSILERFARGEFMVLNNCGILTTGYDEPTVEAIIMNRATKSIALWLQCCGRGSRPIDGSIGGLPTKEERLAAIAASSKPYFTVLDFGMNHDQHGLWSKARDWQIEEPRKKKLTTLDVAPTKLCVNCGSMIYATAVNCIFCGHKFPDANTELKDGVMVRVDESELEPSRVIQGLKISELTTKELAMLQRLKRYSHHYIWRVVRSKGVESLRAYRDEMKYSNGWYAKQRKDINSPDKNVYTDVRIR